MIESSANVQSSALNRNARIASITAEWRTYRRQRPDPVVVAPELREVEQSAERAGLHRAQCRDGARRQSRMKESHQPSRIERRVSSVDVMATATAKATADYTAQISKLMRETRGRRLPEDPDSDSDSNSDSGRARSSRAPPKAFEPSTSLREVEYEYNGEAQHTSSENSLLPTSRCSSSPRRAIDAGSVVRRFSRSSSVRNLLSLHASRLLN